MAQPNKGERWQIQARIPTYLRGDVERYAQDNGLSVSEATADLLAIALKRPIPSDVLPAPKSRTKGQAVLALQLKGAPAA